MPICSANFAAAGADAVVGAGLDQRVCDDAGVVAHDLALDPFDPLGHAGVGALNDQMGDPVSEGVGLLR